MIQTFKWKQPSDEEKCLALSVFSLLFTAVQLQFAFVFTAVKYRKIGKLNIDWLKINHVTAKVMALILPDRRIRV